MNQVKCNGATLWIEERGSGGPPLLLVHGLMPVKLWAPLVERFAARRRVVSVELRGFGRSQGPAGGDFGITTHAEDLQALIAELGLHRPIVVGHSTGGLVALELAGQAPHLLGGVVLLDVPVVVPPPARAHFEGLGQALRAPGFRETLATFAREAGILAPTDPPVVAAEFARVLPSLQQEPLVSLWQSFLAFDGAAAARRCTCPALQLQAVMPCDQAAVREAAPAMLHGAVVGSGHLLHGAVPEQVAPMMERFFALAGLEVRS